LTVWSTHADPHIKMTNDKLNRKQTGINNPKKNNVVGIDET